MKAYVTWFSGTGNSLWAAKQLAALLEAECVPMAHNQAQRVGPDTDSDLVVLVFPVYNHLIPYLVQRFIQQLPSLADKTIYAVCTYGDSPGVSLEYLQRRIAEKGGTLSGGFAVKMPYNYISPSGSLRSVFQPFRLREISPDTQEQLFAAAQEKLADIALYIKAGRRGTLETEYERIERLAERLNLRNTLQKRFWLHKAGYHGKTKMTSVECVQLMDAGFFTTEACMGCQTCARICPVHNISFANGKPHWSHRCEQCFACLQWCPAQALQFGTGTLDGKRYRQPAIRPEEMFLQPQ